LIKGAHKGEGLGNAFLSHISAVDAIYQVVRECVSFVDWLIHFGCFISLDYFDSILNNGMEWHRINNECLFVPSAGIFEDSDVTHVDDSIEPLRDIQIISEELRLKVRLSPSFSSLLIFQFLIASCQSFFSFFC
jgi:obg-like ATPase 1